MRHRPFIFWGFILLFAFSFVGMDTIVFAQEVTKSVAPEIIPQPDPLMTVQFGGVDKPFSVGLQILILLTILSLAPAIFIMMTSFTRIIVVLSFLRQALGTQQAPPNQVLISLALFLTLFIMSPILTKINTEALQPYIAEEITQQEALKRSSEPIRKFMLKQVREKDLSLFVDITKIGRPRNESDIPTHVVIPAFMISELRTAFQIGFLIFLPFLIIDIVVGSVLMSMGMMMLPPVMVSLPFKLILFVLADGWYLIVGSLVKSFA
ncbi:MAG: flagellar type III secretion system pore protein FliP [Nitrospirota bacterium]